MKKILCVILLFPVLLTAEKGELQGLLSGGTYIPLSHTTHDETVYLFATYAVGYQTYFGVTDNLDIGHHGSFSSISNAYHDGEYNDVSGEEYHDYYRMHFDIAVRYNVFPGYNFSPHVFAGAGLLLETYRNRQFYVNDDQLYNQFDGGDYVEDDFLLKGGIDLQYRFWIMIFNVSAAYEHGILHGNNGISITGNVGFRWFFKSLSI